MKKKQLTQREVVKRHLIHAIEAKVMSDGLSAAMVLGGNSDPTNTVLHSTE
jgi:hypothetical protein